jgi:HEAT repeat protein
MVAMDMTSDDGTDAPSEHRNAGPDGQPRRDVSPEEAQAAIDAYLQANDGPTTLGALRTLGKLQVGISHIWDATESGWARMRSTAFEAMGDLPGPPDEHLAFLRAGLRDDNPHVVAAAARAAGRLGAFELADDLRQHADAHSAVIRRQVIFALGRLGTTSDLPALVEAARQPDATAAAAAVRALIQLGRRHPIGGPEIEDLLVVLLSEPNPTDPKQMQLRSSAVDLAGVVPPSDTITDLVRTVLEGGGAGSGRAAIVLGDRAVEDARPDIEGLLIGGAQATHRVELIQGLQRLGIDDSLQTLESLLDGPIDQRGAVAIARAVLDTRDPTATAILLRLAHSPDIAVRASIIRMLPPDHPLSTEVVRVALGDLAVPVRRAAIEAAKRQPELAAVLVSMRASERDPDLIESLAEVDLADAHSLEAEVVTPARAMTLQLGNEASDRALDLVRAHAIGEALATGSEIDEAVAAALRDLADRADQIADQLKAREVLR